MINQDTIALLVIGCFACSSTFGQAREPAVVEADPALQQTLRMAIENRSRSGLSWNTPKEASPEITALRNLSNGNERHVLQQWLLLYKDLSSGPDSESMKEAACDLILDLHIARSERSAALNPRDYKDLRKLAIGQGVFWLVNRSDSKLYYLSHFKPISEIEQDEKLRDTFAKATAGAVGRKYKRATRTTIKDQQTHLKNSDPAIERHAVEQWIAFYSGLKAAGATEAQLEAAKHALSALNTSTPARREALIPFLGGEDENTRKVVLDSMWIFTDPELTGVSDPGVIRDLVIERGRLPLPPFTTLMEYLCAVEPDMAGSVIWAAFPSEGPTSVEMTRKLDATDEAIGAYVKLKRAGANAKKLESYRPRLQEDLLQITEIESAAVHFYISAILEQHPELQNELLIKKLEAQSHPAVKAMVARIRKAKS